MSCTKYMKVNMTDLVYIKKDTVGPVYQQTTTKNPCHPIQHNHKFTCIHALYWMCTNYGICVPGFPGHVVELADIILPVMD